MPIPQALERTWEALHNEVVAVHARWIIFRQLFAQSQERLDILNWARDETAVTTENVKTFQLLRKLKLDNEPKSLDLNGRISADFRTAFIRLDDLNAEYRKSESRTAPVSVAAQRFHWIQ